MPDLLPILVVGGTGMLRPAVHALLERGRDVALLARRPARGAPGAPTPGTFLPVAGDWTAPSGLADDVLAATDGRHVTTVVAWVHAPHRAAVLEGLPAATIAGAAVIHLWGSAARDSRQTIEEIDLGGDRRARHVLLGYRSTQAGSRWLTDGEISAAVLRALDGSAAAVVAGQLDPWDQRP